MADDIPDIVINLNDSSPERCVQLVHTPSVHVFFGLKVKIQQSGPEWLTEFLHLGGMGALLDSLEQMSGTTMTSFCDAILQLDCIACLQALLNTTVGMDYLVTQDSYVRQLVLAIDTHNVLPKRHVLELMCGACVYSTRGHSLLIEGLEVYKKELKQQERFSVLVNELKTAETIPFKTTVLSLINCIIGGTQELLQRNRIRNEFIGLQIMDILNFIRKGEKDDDLSIQLQLFTDQQNEDEASLSRRRLGDFNNHQEVFNMVQQKVYGKPSSSSFLSILQDLLLIETNAKDSALQWQAAVKVLHCVACSSQEQLETLVKTTTETLKPTQPKTILNNLKKVENTEEIVNSKAVPKLVNYDISDLSAYDDVAAPSIGEKSSYHTAQKSKSYHTAVSSHQLSSTSGVKVADTSVKVTLKPKFNIPIDYKRMSQVPKPNKPMKLLKWVKLNTDQALRQGSVWRSLGGMVPTPLDTPYLEEAFAETETNPEDEIQLLSGHDCLQMSLFLDRLELSPQELVEYVEDCDTDHLSTEAVQFMMKILPEPEEIDMLHGYSGDRILLAPGEQFLLALSDLPDYKVLLEGLLFKAESRRKFQSLKVAFTAIIKSSQEVLHNQGLRQFLKLVLTAGNFINTGKHTGGALGLKLASLPRLKDLRSNSTGASLLHHLVARAETINDAMLLFVNDLTTLERAASHSLEDLRKEFMDLNTQLRKFLQQLGSADPKVKDTFEFFVEDVKRDLHSLQDCIVKLRELSQQVAKYFCEEGPKYDLQSCLKNLASFCHDVRKCRKENAVWSELRAVGDKRRQVLEEDQASKQLAKLMEKNAVASSSVMVKPEGILDHLLEELHRGKVSPHCRQEQEEDNLLMMSAISPLKMEGNMKAHGHFVYSTECLNMEPEVLETRQRDHEQGLRGCKKGVQRKVENSIKAGRRIEVKRDGLNGKPPMAPPTGRVIQVMTHRRTHSDLNESHSAIDRWRQYETKVKTEPKAVAQPESQCAVAALGLHQKGKVLSIDDVTAMNQKSRKPSKSETPPTEMTRKEPKRSSFGLLKRISRAVLKPRNTNGPIQTGKREGSFGKGKKKFLSNDKENLEAHVIQNKSTSPHLSQKGLSENGKVTLSKPTSSYA